MLASPPPEPLGVSHLLCEPRAEGGGGHVDQRVFLCLLTQRVFIEQLLCARYCSRTMKEKGRIQVTF